MPILERSVATAGARTTFTGRHLVAMFGVTLVSLFLAGATLAIVATPWVRASLGPGRPVHHSARHPSVRLRAAISPGDRATIVDVAPGVTDDGALKLVRLAPGEHVVTVDDCPADRLTACALLRQPRPRPSFRDLEITGGHGGPRRVVLLLH